MGLSNYQAFMECMRKWEKIGCKPNGASGRLWKWSDL